MCFVVINDVLRLKFNFFFFFELIVCDCVCFLVFVIKLLMMREEVFDEKIKFLLKLEDVWESDIDIF